ncbi:MAG: indole-3-glycerol phosphate synthase TrpC [Vicinamibacterales bacterium]
MADVLTEIVDRTRRDLDARKALVPLAFVERAALARRAPGGERFRTRLARRGAFNVIAECKRRSPSKGTIRTDYWPARIASGYERAGAACLSVVTEPHFFGGAPSHFSEVRAATALPILWKDFILDDYQILEARAAGADAVLLITSVVSEHYLGRLVRRARALGLEPLVEVRNERELCQAVEAGASTVGINNRDLQSQRVDLATSEQLARHVPDGTVAVAESGIRSGADLARLAAAGYCAFLVGEALMAASDPALALAEMIHVAEDLRHHG